MTSSAQRPPAPKRALFNPLQGGGRSKIWAVDAKANIAYFQYKLDAIRIRSYTEVGQARAAAEAAARRPVHSGLRQAGSKLTTLSRRTAHSTPDADRTRSEAEIANTCLAVSKLLDKASVAADGRDPQYRPVWSWWSGTGPEAAYKNLHYAEAAIARLYNQKEIRAEIPDVVRRARDALAENNPTRAMASRLVDDGKVVGSCTAEELSTIISLSHEAADRNHSKLRTFRSTMLVGTLILTLLLLGLVVLAAARPTFLPLCFTQEPPPASPGFAVACPTGDGLSRQQTTGASAGLPTPGPAREPESGDAFIVAVMGLIGGALSAGVFIRGMYSNGTPYNVAIPLALLKVPVGGLVAIGGIILLAGDFVPGFTAIDKQVQILAYALVFGFAQQLFTNTLDQRAEKLIANVPTKGKKDDKAVSTGSSPSAA